MRDATETLLNISNFVTIWQDYFRGDDEPLENKHRYVSPRDIEGAILHRHLLEEVVNLRYQLLLKSSASHLNCEISENDSSIQPLKKILEEKEEELRRVSKRQNCISRIMKRMEVWMTKDLAQATLMISDPKDDAKGGSPLLNLPSAASMDLSLDHTIPMPRRRCWSMASPILANQTLLLPPNRWTWQEYLRLVYPISLLVKDDDCTQVSQSSITATTIMFQERKDDLKLSLGLKLSPVDLVALWVRSQRNTSAWRHLTQLFVIEKRKITSDQNNQLIEEEYAAIFQPNHSKVGSLTKQDPGPMDALVEWAVLNQVLFTQWYIVQRLEKGDIPIVALDLQSHVLELDHTPSADVSKEEWKESKSRKNHAKSTRSNKRRLRVSEESLNSKRKRRLSCQVQSERLKTSLLQAKQSFILRLFARRNRKVTSILFSKFVFNTIPFYASLVESLVGAGVLEKIKVILRDDFNSGDRTMTRIDRRITSIGKYVEGQSLVDTILVLLESLKSASAGILPFEDIEKAKKDFEQLFHLFLNEGTEKAISMVPVDQMVAQLESVQPPWHSQCGVCNKGYDEGDTPVFCNNCEMSMHHHCKSAEAALSMGAIVKNYPPLLQIFWESSFILQDPPDFRNSKGLEWSRLEITFKTSSDGLRVGVQHTETCKQTLESLISQSRVSNREVDVKSRHPLYPLIVQHDGVLITDILPESPMLAAGAQISDIITHCKRSGDADFVVMRNKDKNSRVALLKHLKNATVTFILQRPNKNLISLSHKWLETYLNPPNLSFKLPDSEMAAKEVFCKDCIGSNKRYAEKSKAEKAKLCLAVIRRLSMESYALPFHDSYNHYLEESSISLRRLDEIMQSFIYDKGMQNPWPFSQPPQLNACQIDLLNVPKRLDWISDSLMNDPFSLLCSGMNHLLMPSGLTKDDLLGERTALATHFLNLFVSWCLRNTVDIGCIRTVGPKTNYSSLSSLWISDTCKVCMFPTSCSTDTGNGCCNRKACQVAEAGLTKLQVSHESSPEDEISVPLNHGLSHIDRVFRYNQLASFVGSVLLILPGDNVLDIPSHFLQQSSIKSNDRPTPFIVASYLPSYFVKLNPGSCIKSSDHEKGCRFDGVYHLLPVIYCRQLTFLQKLARFRSPPSVDQSSTILPKNWTDLSILNLPGVVCVTPSQLFDRIQISKKVQEAIDLSVCLHASCKPFCDDLNAKLKSLSVSDEISEGLPMFEQNSSNCEEGTQDFPSKLLALIESTMEYKCSRWEEVMKAFVIDNDDDRSVIIDDDIESEKSVLCDILDDSIPQKLPETTFHSDTRDFDKISDATSEKQQHHEFDNGSKSSDEASQISAFRPPNTTIGRRPNNASSIDSKVQERYDEPHDEEDTCFSSSNSRTHERHAADFDNDQAALVDKTIMFERNIVTVHDLFRAGPVGTYLTIVETAVVAGYLEMGQSSLARRILCPRYRFSQAEEQVKVIQQLTKSSISMIPAQILESLSVLDQRRSSRQLDRAGIGNTTYEALDSICIDSFVGGELQKLEIYQHSYDPQNEVEIRNSRNLAACHHFSNSDKFFPHARTEKTLDEKRKWIPSLQFLDTQNEIHRFRDRSSLDRMPTGQLILSPIRKPLNLHGSRISERVNYSAIVDEDPISRIRGGGPLDYSPPRLVDIPKNDWLKRLVTGKVETTKKGATLVEATIVGFVGSSAVDADDDSVVSVDVIFVSNHGLLDQASSQVLPILSLYVVEDGSEEAAIARTWKEQRGIEQIQIIRESEQSLSVFSSLPPQEKLGNELVMKMLNVGGNRINLGNLPDGRSVYWSPYDISSLRLTQVSDELQTLKRASDNFFDDVVKPSTPLREDLQGECKSLYYCCWGCKESASEGKINYLGFSGLDELIGHLQEFHNYSTEKYFTFSGKSIRKLASDLTTAACIRWPKLLKMKARDSEPVQFDLVHVMIALESKGHDSLKCVLEGYTGDQMRLHGFISVWSTFARLFDLNNLCEPKLVLKDVKLKFAPSSLGVFNTEENLDNNKNQAIESEEDKNVSKDCCFDGLVLSDHLNFMQCSLCCGDSESCLKRVDGTLTGLGCSLISSLRDDSCAKIVYPGPSSLLSMSKTILVHLASSLPRPLRHKSEYFESINVEGSSKFGLWQDGQFQKWCKFVENSDNIQMISQAFIVFLSSINKAKLPLWWRSARAGWSKSFVLMARMTASGLLLHLYVVDAAIAEFRRENTSTIDCESTPSDADPIPRNIREMDFKERMTTILKWAQDLDLKEYEGFHGYQCVRCHEVGELLRCVYCANVQHLACCIPPILDPSPICSWVCDSCIRDIVELKESPG